MTLSFPYLSGRLIDLRELTMVDATNIVNLMDYEIAKYLYEVQYPYKIDDALNFIKSSYEYFKLRKAITFV
jgi:[ribosomal protein S5]-alanine N-acetyltransferase